MAITAGEYDSFCLCSDGTVAAWGNNVYGQLGNNSTTNSSVPVLVDQTGALVGKTVDTLAAGGSHTLALSSDATLVAWGFGGYGQLGNNNTNNSSVPVAVITSALRTGERFLAAAGGYRHSLAIVAAPPLPVATTLAASGILDTGATLNGSFSAQGTTATVTIEYGPTVAYGTTLTPTPATVNGTATMTASATLNGLPANTTYHYRVVAAGSGGTTTGEDVTFTTSACATLAGLTLSRGTLMPAPPSNKIYFATVPAAVDSITMTPVAATPNSTVMVNGEVVASGASCSPISLSTGENVVPVVVAAPDGVNILTYSVKVTRLPQTFTYNTATDVPLIASDFVAAGFSVTFVLNHAPSPGTNLSVVKNTGIAPIVGAFDNLAQGQRVDLTFGGITYPFVVNYRGGTGNDLVLQWANTRLLAWGYNGYGQLGNHGWTNSSVAVPVDTSGMLAGKILMAVAAGETHSLALCADGSLAAWGNSNYGQLGNSGTSSSNIPVPVETTGILAGRTIIAISAGISHSLALCSDGTLAAWGYNLYGQLGNNTLTNSTVPVAVDLTGVLAGRTVVAIAAGGYFNLALCADGTLAAWGMNNNGQLGNNSTTNSSVPVAVTLTGVLAGRTVTTIAAGGSHCLALCADGTLVAWGNKTSGQLGSNSPSSNVPVPVVLTGVLAGKLITAIAAGNLHSLALCADGTIAAWGDNSYGQLGNKRTTSSSVPVAVDLTGVLAGRTGIAGSAGYNHNLALCADGFLAAWGNNSHGQLGDNSTGTRTAPVPVALSNLGAGERFMAIAGGGEFSLALVAMPPPPMASTLTALGITDTQAQLNGSVNAMGTSATVTFEYGLTTLYGTTLGATPATLTGSTATAATATPTALLPGSTYHYRIVARGTGGSVTGEDMTFTTSALATLSNLTLSGCALAPAFASSTTTYLTTVPYATDSITVTPVVYLASSTVTVNAIAVTSGAASAPINLQPGENPIVIKVTSAGGTNTITYSVKVVRLPQTFTFNSATDAPMTLSDLAATGTLPTPVLNYAPSPGASLMIVRNTGTNPIRGTFDNLPQGELVSLPYNGITYIFAANYFGGTGNDLVLQWANTCMLAWGDNSYGQLGINSTTNSGVAVPVDINGVLTGKTVVTTANGFHHVLALCSDGTVAAWGENSYGKLGTGNNVSSNVPVSVNMVGALAGKKVVAIAASGSHSLALCSDGTLIEWGRYFNGQANNSSTKPALVDQTGVLAGKTVTAIAAGDDHSVALCSDGTLATWGYNTNGQLGNNSNADFSVPVRVSTSGVLAGKTVTAIAAGAWHNLALCSDGTLVAWGYNNYGQLGNNSTTNANAPVAATQTGVLAGKTVTTIAGGGYHSLALCSDGTLTAWGNNSAGQLGNNSTANSSVPVSVSQTGVLLGKTVAEISCGGYHSLIRCSDGTMVAWGNNGSGQLGNNNTTNSGIPSVVPTTALMSGARVLTATAGSLHCLAVAAVPQAPLVTTLAATSILDSSATLNGNVTANGIDRTVSIEYGLTTSYGNTAAATPGTVTGTANSAVSTRVSGLLTGATYHYRVIATTGYLMTKGKDMSFTTGVASALTDISTDHGTLYPIFTGSCENYITTLPFAMSDIALTLLAADNTSTIKINGMKVPSGVVTGPYSLLVGENDFAIMVVTAGGIQTKTYHIQVIRLPEAFTYNSATNEPLTVSNLFATGVSPVMVLHDAPAPGTRWTLVRNTGMNPIHGAFANLAQGQVVNLAHGGADYAFVVNYHGGTGNDLVLQWANTRLLSWGYNNYGQLGNNSTTNSSIPVPVDVTGVLAGKTVIGMASGLYHSLALCSDGTLAAWGYNNSGQLGNNSTSTSSIPVPVVMSGVLAGKMVTVIAACNYHSLVLCADGTLAAWGSNNYGQLGNGTTTNSWVPVVVDLTGVLAGRRVIAIAVGNDYSLALCSDNTVAAWGYNNTGQLGNGTTTASKVPVLVNQTGVLAGGTVIAIAAGGSHNLALCGDGAVAAWGSNYSGQLGDGTTTNSKVPVQVNQTGVLANKTVTAIAAGGSHSLALCADATLAAWGSNGYGSLGDNSTLNSYVPVRVDQTAVLANRTVTAIAAGGSHSLAACTDGPPAAWGGNTYGQLGNFSSTNSSVPVPVMANMNGLVPGMRYLTVSGGSAHSIALAACAMPRATLRPATAITGTGATMTGNVDGNGNITTVAFEYGLTSTYGNTLAASPISVTSGSDADVGANLSGLLPGTTYHYRVVASCSGVFVRSTDMTFTTLSADAMLSAFTLSSGLLTPAFDKTVTSYLTTVSNAMSSLTVTPTTEHPAAAVQVNGVPVASGTASAPISLPVGNTTLTARVTAEDGIDTMSYVITVTRLPESFVFNAASDVPVTAKGFAAGGYPVNVRLNYAPTPGTILTMLNNTGLGFIHGAFSNLAQGQRIGLTFNGNTYDFVVNFYGGSGNDLVLQWAATQVVGWGSNSYGQLGDTTTTRRLLPTSIDATGVLAGKTIIAVTEGYLHSLALCSDGTLAAWGYNVYGQLGNNSSAPSSVPVAVDRSGVLAGKTVIAIAAGPFHNLALCADGSVVAWGYNNYGQLGTGDTATRRVPVLVNPIGALAGKQVVAVAAGAYHSFALCADGTLAAWGFNDDGELGDGTTTGRLVPVAANTSGALAGKQIAYLTSGQYHTLALCTDGTLLAWGYNNRGQLGNNSTNSSKVPVAIGAFGALTGKSVVAVCASVAHSLALCADGTLAAWGWNQTGQLGVAGIIQSPIPMAIDMTAVTAGARWMAVASGSATQHNLAVVGLPSVSLTPHASGLQGLAVLGADQGNNSGVIAYAFGLNATTNGGLPQGQWLGGRFVMRFNQPAGVIGITYGAEWSTTLLPGSWLEVPDTGTGDEHLFNLPTDAGPHAFLRLKVTSTTLP